MENTQSKINEIIQDQGLVLYTDGSVRPTNPGYGGAGIHGYLFSYNKPKKGSGNSDHVLTDKGYILKTEYNTNPELHNEITPISYIDAFTSFSYEISNNIAEVMAATIGLEISTRFSLKSIFILTDSEYVQKGITEWLPIWKKNNWLRRDGTEPANTKYWKDIDVLLNQIISKGIDIKVEWIKGHADHLGNELADKLAILGTMSSKQKDIRSIVDIQAAEGYWKYSPDKHPFISNRRMYFNTINAYARRGEYFLGDHGKDDDLIGKRISDGAYAVTVLDEPEPILEVVRDYQLEISGDSDTIMMVRLDHLYRPDTHKQIMNYGKIAMEQSNPYRLDLRCLDGEPLTRELRPPKLAMWAVESLSYLANKLHQYLDKDKIITCTDITNIIYDIEEKENKKKELKKIYKLKSEYNVGFASLQVIANYSHNNEILTCPITLTLGLDLLERNSLKRLEDHEPKITLITWLEAPHIFRYASVIETINGRGIWASVHSNLMIVPQKK